MEDLPLSAFLAGVVFGAIFMGSIFTIFTTRAKRPRRDPIDWTSEFHEPAPIVTTRILVNRRNIEI